MNTGIESTPYPWETSVFRHEIARNEVMDKIRGTDRERVEAKSEEDNKYQATADDPTIGQDDEPEEETGDDAGLTRAESASQEDLPSFNESPVNEVDPESITYGEKPPFVNEEPYRPDETGKSDRNQPVDEGSPAGQEDSLPRYRGILHLWRNPFIRGIGALIIVLGIILLGYSLFQEPSSDGALVLQQQAPALDDTPGGEVQQTSPQYQETLSAYNDGEADRAEREERSFFATTESVPASLDQPEPDPPNLSDESVLEPVVSGDGFVRDVTPETPVGAITFGPGNQGSTGDVSLEPLDEAVLPSPLDPLPPSTYAGSLFYNEPVQTPLQGPAVPGSNPVLDTLRELTKIPVPTMRSDQFGSRGGERSIQAQFPSGEGVVTDTFIPGTIPTANGLLTSQSSVPQLSGLADPLSVSGNLPNSSIPPSDVNPTPVNQNYLQGRETAESPTTVSVGETNLLAAGTIIHAEMVNGLNSDQPGVAVAEIIEYPLQGARVLGRFTPNLVSGGLALEFQTLVLPDGSSQPVSAFGLSPWTGENLTRSILRPRILQRYGPTALLAFVSGASALMLEDGQQIVVANDAVYQERSAKIEDRQIIAAGVTALASQVATDIQAKAPTGPQILLYPGSTVALLFATSVIDTTQRSLP